MAEIAHLEQASGEVLQTLHLRISGVQTHGILASDACAASITVCCIMVSFLLTPWWSCALILAVYAMSMGTSFLAVMTSHVFLC